MLALIAIYALGSPRKRSVKVLDVEAPRVPLPEPSVGRGRGDRRPLPEVRPVAQRQVGGKL